MGKIKEGLKKTGAVLTAVATVASTGVATNSLLKNSDLNKKIESLNKQEDKVVQSVLLSEEYKNFINKNIVSLKDSHVLGEISDENYEREIKVYEDENPEVIKSNVERFLTEEEGLDNKLNKLEIKAQQTKNEYKHNQDILAGSFIALAAGLYATKKLIDDIKNNKEENSNAEEASNPEESFNSKENFNTEELVIEE